ncbi:hypothetical protein [Marinoscillum sp. 108]|uniref:hypothetical protein n=1 Tax=Marinoscillum sp. 108 TaxID=2653151 RepID=UPI0012F308A4|nr:hypothetical protein [Marinoscillum sp. 108]VXD14209.1 conserved exported hypothetical protein [Marinoscillum sp. 108]
MKIRLIIFFNLFVAELIAHGQTQLTAGMSYTRQSLTWSIAGNLNGTSPNIFSELKWQRVMGVGALVAYQHPITDRIVAFAEHQHQLLVQGSVTDSDYEGDDRTGRVFFAKEDAGKGYTLASQGGLLYQVCKRKSMTFTLGGGYGLMSQRFFLLNEKMGLRSSYTNQWYGPLLTGRLQLLAESAFGITLKTTYHQVRYHATGNWNLIERFQHPVSFRHRAKGFGLENQLVMSYKMSGGLCVEVRPSYGYWTTGMGIDTVYKKDQSTPKTRLNDVTTEVLGVEVGVVWRLTN